MNSCKRSCLALLILATYLALGSHSDAQLLVANNSDNPGQPQAWNVDPNTANATPLWNTSAEIDVWGMAYDPSSQQIYASAGSRLYAGTTDSTPGFLGGINDGAGNLLTMPGLAWAYGVRGVGDEAIFEIDVNTLEATIVLDFPELDYDFGGLAFNPDDGLFYGTSDSLAAEGVGLYSIDVFGNGNIQQVVAYPAGEFDVDGLAIGNNVAYLIEDDTGNTIHPVDLATGMYLPDLLSPFLAGEVFSAGAFITSASIDGDFNNDFRYDCADADALVAEIAAGTNTLSFDLNGDGLVNLDDRDLWLVEAGGQELASENPYLLGDANLDGTVDGGDFLEWNDNKFTSVPAWCSADFNADGEVDGGDFLIWNDNKFTSSDINTVPEPSSFWLWLLALASSMRKSRIG